MTARGWEDLSALLLTYEALGFACTQTQAREYLHVQEAAAGFAAFYELYRRYAASLPLEALLRGQTDAGAEALRGLPFEGRLSVVEFLLHSL
ncbi:MAG: ATPase, partial [Oscillospiraceae bacterium]